MMLPGSKPGQCYWRHLLLVPKLPTTEREKAHFEKTVKVLDGMTYAGEDMWVSEQIQLGLDAGAKTFRLMLNRAIKSETATSAAAE